MIPYLRFAILSGTYLPRPYMGFPLPPKTSRVTWQVNWTWIWTTNARVFWIQIYEMIHILFLVTCHRKFHVFHKKVILVGHVINQGKKTCMLGVSWCCGNYCLLAFVLWCGYCSVSFQSFVLRHWCPQHQETTCMFDVACFMQVLHVWPKKII